MCKTKLIVALKRLRDGEIPDIDQGICANVVSLAQIDNHSFYTVIEPLFRTWELFSWDVVYPIPNTYTLSHFSPCQAYWVSVEDGCIWRGTQLGMRMSLIEHLIAELEKQNAGTK